MDISPLVTAGLGLISGAVAGWVGSWYRNRLDTRSAARLIHAELTENTAAVRYFRKLGSWPKAGVRHTAWDAYAETLSRKRAVKSFHTIRQGYTQLDGILYLAEASRSSEDGLPRPAVKEILETAIAEVAQALHEAGRLAGMDPATLHEQAAAMVEATGAKGLSPGQLAAFGVAPPGLLDTIAQQGSALQQEFATKTLEETERLRREAAPVPGGSRRRVFDAKGSSDLGGLAVARSEGEPPTGDSTVDAVYDHLGAFHRFFAEVFGRDSIDGQGQELTAVVHYSRNYDNMFWDGTRVVAGDGSGTIFNDLAKAPELVAKELSFGVIEREAGLEYQGQPGALSQSISLVFGSLVKQYANGQTADQADWLIGAGVLAEGIQGVALNSMKAPGTAYDDPTIGKDPQPDHMKDYVETEDDNGGVHINSSIPNHAFYKVATSLGGHAWARAGRIWYDALLDPGVRAKTGFRRFARATVEAAERLYGEDSEESNAVYAGWADVGVKPSEPRNRPRQSSSLGGG